MQIEVYEMINIEKAKKEFENHINQLALDDFKVPNKKMHMYRVAGISKTIAMKLGLPEEKIQLAELIGLLHDIGRFEQYKIKVSAQKFDHGEAGVEVLKKDNYIRSYIEDSNYDDIIYKAIYEHNKYQLPQGLPEETELFCKIIKDADKIDLIYEAVFKYWQEPERKSLVEEGRLSEKMLEDFYVHKLTDNRNSISEADQILRFTSFVFDINFLCSLQILKENDNVSKMIDRFNYQIPETKEKMQEVKKIANEYIEEKLKGTVN